MLNETFSVIFKHCDAYLEEISEEKLGQEVLIEFFLPLNLAQNARLVNAP